MTTNFKLAWRNLWRNRRRTLITVASIFFGVLLSAYMTSMQEGSYEKMVDIVVKFYSGYIQIHNEKYWENKSINNTFDYDEALVRKVQKHKEVEMVFPRLESFALASSDELTKGAMVFGINPEKEDQWTGLSSKIKEGRYLENGDKGVIIGEGLASYLKLGVNDTLVLISQGYHGISAAGMFPIKGLVKHASPDLNKVAVYMDLANCQEFYSAPNKITSLVVNVKKSKDMQPVFQKLKKEVTSPYLVMNWEEMQPEIVQQIESDRAGGVVMKAVLYIVIAFGILATIMMMIAERRKEFGVMVAVGMQKHRLAVILFIETFLIGLLGVVAGIVVSFPIISYQVGHPIPLTGQTARLMEDFGFEPYLFFSKQAIVFTQQALTIFVLSMLIGIYPIVASLRLRVIKALRS
ncbi:Lipoprotein release ABC-type transport system, LolE-like permease protein [hydrothermal vent metagenome]|uniref:Lipoprotein release ABC-type transport system, LolE-like permease protein n=1 Tax=hydrothermal vent metagenome TaxID=652676 RepID=A0A3B0TS36_9ZZZZ